MRLIAVALLLVVAACQHNPPSGPSRPLVMAPLNLPTQQAPPRMVQCFPSQGVITCM